MSANIVPRGCAGTLAVVLAQSIDYTRTRLGVDARNPAGQRQFTGIVDCYVKTVRADGLRSGQYSAVNGMIAFRETEIGLLVGP